MLGPCQGVIRKISGATQSFESSTMEAERRWRYSSVDREFCMGDGGKDKT
jgi:hypothetical protein